MFLRLFPGSAALFRRFGHGAEQLSRMQPQQRAQHRQDQRKDQDFRPDAGEQVGKRIGDQHPDQPACAGGALGVGQVQAGGVIALSQGRHGFRLTAHKVQVGRRTHAAWHPGDERMRRQHQQIQRQGQEKAAGRYPVPTGNQQPGARPIAQKYHRRAQRPAQAKQQHKQLIDDITFLHAEERQKPGSAQRQQEHAQGDIQSRAPACGGGGGQGLRFLFVRGSR